MSIEVPVVTELDARINDVRLAQRENDAAKEGLENIISAHDAATDRLNASSEALYLAREKMYESVVEKPWTETVQNEVSGIVQPVRVAAPWEGRSV